MDATTTRLFTTVSRVTCAAEANRASVAALSPIPQSNAMFCFTSGQTSGTSGVGDVRQIGDGGLDIVVHRDQFGRIARRRRGVGNDERHRVADVAHRALGKREMWRVRHV